PDVVIDGAVAGAGVGGDGGLPPPGPLMTIVNSRCACAGRHQSADGGFWSLRLTQNEKLPACVGVPPTWPLIARLKPGGRLPPMIVNWYGRAGPQPPAPWHVKLYGVPTVPVAVGYVVSVNLIVQAADGV